MITIPLITGLPTLESTEIPQDLMNMFFFIIFILIIILVLIAIFIALLLFWLKRQSKIHFPVKPKVVMRKERTIINIRTKNEDEKKVEKTDLGKELPKAKPVEDQTKSAKVTAVKPIRITGHSPPTAKSVESKTETTEDDNIDVDDE